MKVTLSPTTDDKVASLRLVDVQEGIIKGWFDLPKECREYIEWSGLSRLGDSRTEITIKARLCIPLLEEGGVSHIKTSLSFVLDDVNNDDPLIFKDFVAERFKEKALTTLRQMEALLDGQVKRLRSALR